jgi:tetratricopeptide (TPR) repeat protein
MLPEQRRVENLDQPIAELISWGLLTPIYEDGQLETLAVHSLVRDFCRDKQKDEIWRTRLCEASVFYINRTKLLSQDEKPLPLVWGEMEAFELLMEAEDWQDATNLLYGTQALLIRWGFGRYLESQYRRLLEKVDRATAAKIGHNLGVLLEDRGDYVVALTMYEKARNILEELGDRAGVTKPLHQIGIIHQRRGNYSAALAEYEKALKIAGEFDDHVQVAICLHQIGMIYQYRGEHAAALVKYEKALKIKEELGDRAGMARSLRQIGMIHHDRGDYSAALVEYEKALKIMEELGDRVGIASSLHTIGNTHYLSGNFAAALTMYEKALKIFEELGYRAEVACSLHQIGMIYQACKDYVAALAEYDKALKIKEELSDRTGMANSHFQIGQVLTQTGRCLEAFSHLLFALATLMELQSTNAEIVVEMFKVLRAKWGAENFDTAWQQATGEAVPEWLK